MEDIKEEVLEEEMGTSLTEEEAKEVYGEALPEIPEVIGVVNEDDFLEEGEESEE